MTVHETTIDGYRYSRGNEPGIVTKHWPAPSRMTERYRKIKTDPGYEYFSNTNLLWCPGLAGGSYRNHVLTAIDRLWPTTPKVEPFGPYQWIPAGQGCVRTTKTFVYYHRVRRCAAGLEWQCQNTHDKTWHANPFDAGNSWTTGAQAALDHFWPSPAVATLSHEPFDDGDGDKWIRMSPDKVVPVLPARVSGSFHRLGDKVMRVIGSDCEWEVRADDPLWQGRVVRHFWPELFEKKKPPMTMSEESPVAWTFKAAPEDIDLPRILREAYDAGAREVTVDRSGLVTTYLHNDKRATVAAWWLCTQSTVRGQCFADFACGSPVPGWEIVGHPCLAEAREWQLTARQAKEARRVVVKVTGVR